MNLPVIEEGAKKSNVLWLGLPSGVRLAWHVWHDGAVYVVTGGGEQPLPGLAELAAGRGEIEVVLRSKDNGAELVRFPAIAEVVDQAAAPEAVAALAKERLNARDAAGLTARWVEGSTVVRLTPAPEPPSA